MSAMNRLATVNRNAPRTTIGDDYRWRVARLRQELEALLGVANKLVNEVNEVGSTGGTLVIQPQLNYLTGCVARIQKDFGVIEHLQTHGATLRRAVRA